VSRAENAFGFKATTGFDEGLGRTIAWYLDAGRTSRAAS
jgi:nucleoside-diphosphate-sugar epimerase